MTKENQEQRELTTHTQIHTQRKKDWNRGKKIKNIKMGNIIHNM